MTPCKHEIHLFPENEDEAKHNLDKDCPCKPTVSKAYEEDEDSEDESVVEISFYEHQRAH